MKKGKEKERDYKELFFLSLFSLLFVLILLFIFVVLYFYNGDIQSQVPKSIAKEYRIKEHIYQQRSVFEATAKQGVRNEKVILYLHGGSYMAELCPEHWSFVRDIVNDTGATVLIPDYPLTPQYQYTDVFAMLYPLYLEILKQVPEENLILMGDSAGGGIALALAEKIGEENIVKPSKTVLISPWLDVTLTNENIEEVQKKDPILNKQALQLVGSIYAGENGMTNYLVSPILGPLKDLQNVTIFTGTADIFYPDIQKLEKLAKEEKVSIQVKETKDAIHDWILNRYLEESYNDEKAQRAYLDLVELLKK